MNRMSEDKSQCPPSPRHKCPGGCMPGQCLNANCNVQLHVPPVLGHPDIEHEAHLRRQYIENAKSTMEKEQKLKYLAESKRQMGMQTFSQDCNRPDDKLSVFNDLTDGDCYYADYRCPKSPDVPLKPMRPPARPSCMLDPPPFTPPTDDYNDLSRFLRVSTMPGYSNNEFVSEYHDNHNMSVWNNRKDIDPQVYKMKRDWLSVWGEFNVKEQTWRKAWSEKFGA